MRDTVIFLIGGVVAIGGYLMIGDPGRSDNPISERHSILLSKEIKDLSPNEITVRLQKLIKERPSDPEPHFYLGQHLVLIGKDDEATQAYLAALRRYPQHVPALVALGDIETKKSRGKVTDSAARAYQQAYKIDNQQIVAGFKVGLSFWQNKKFDQAKNYWDDLLNQMDSDTQEGKNIQAWIIQVTGNVSNLDAVRLETDLPSSGDSP